MPAPSRSRSRPDEGIRRDPERDVVEHLRHIRPPSSSSVPQQPAPDRGGRSGSPVGQVQKLEWHEGTMVSELALDYRSRSRSMIRITFFSDIVGDVLSAPTAWLWECIRSSSYASALMPKVNLLSTLIFMEENMCALRRANTGAVLVLTALGLALSVAVFASPALAVHDSAAIAGKFGNTEAAASFHIGESVQSNCDQRGCRFGTSKIYCEQEEPDAPVRCVTPLDAIQIAKSSYWYTRRSCQFYAGGGRRTPQETEACRRAHGGSQIRFCRDQQRRGPLPCGPNQ